LSRHSGCAVILPHYRLAPEHPFPAAFEDALTSYRFLVEEAGLEPESILVGGDSAGGQLAVAVSAAMGAADLPAPAGLLLISPWLDLDPERLTGIDRTVHDPFFSVLYANACGEVYVGTGDRSDNRLNVLTSELSHLPPVLLQVGGTEVLCDGADELASALRRAGVPITLQVWPGQVHVWHAFADLVPEGRWALREAGAFIRDRLKPGSAAPDS
jgi:acetyl esterase/lipase